MTWFAPITLIAPPNLGLAQAKAVLSHVHVGFIQYLTIKKLRGTYNNNKTRESLLQGKTLLDLYKASTKKPYYIARTSPKVPDPNPDFFFFFNPGNDFVNKTALGYETQKTILGYDTPSFDVPLTYQMLTKQQIDKGGNGSFIRQIEGDFHFTTNVVASIDDSDGFDGVYWTEAYMQWSFQENDKVIPGPNINPPSRQTWLADPINATVTPPTEWKAPDGEDGTVHGLLEEGGPDDYANKLLSEYKFKDPSKK